MKQQELEELGIQFDAIKKRVANGELEGERERLEEEERRKAGGGGPQTTSDDPQLQSNDENLPDDVEQVRNNGGRGRFYIEVRPSQGKT